MAEKVIILGGGESGAGAALLAKEKGYSPFVSDSGMLSEEVKKELDGVQIQYEEQGHSEHLFDEASLVIKSPGIPQSAEVVQKAVESQLPLIAEIEFAWRYARNKVIGITGTNGKTTTTSLVAHLLNTGGTEALQSGNIGWSFSRAVKEKPDSVQVVEVSSFQLDDCEKFNPDIAVLLNITPDHLDRYENNLEKYTQSKFRIVRHFEENNVFIYNAEDPVTNNSLFLAKNFRGEPKGAHKAVAINKGDKQLVNAPLYIWPAGRHIYLRASGGGDVLIPMQNMPLKGRHNMVNIMSALLVASEMGLTREMMVEGLTSFTPVPHRMELVKTINEVDFINDSKATNVEAVYYAIQGLAEEHAGSAGADNKAKPSEDKKIIWIAGGTDKGNDYSKLDDVAGNIKYLIALGKDNSKLLSHFAGEVPGYLETQSMEEAVRKAYEQATPGDVVLLSPACASFDLFQNYEDRGNQFKNAVNGLT